MKKTDLPFKISYMNCIPEPFTIARLNSERNIIDENPEYQRQAGRWSSDKKELFIDSLINGYDIPKIYFHDLRNKRGQKDFAIVDGKQRITTIYEFLNDEFTLGTGFELSRDGKVKKAKTGDYFKDFETADKDRFKSISIPIIAVQNATKDDIDELFSRLNNGEPLSGAESRNGIGGKMAALIREISTHKFFTEKLRVNDLKGGHKEIAAKFILLEWVHSKHNNLFTDLKKRYLDAMVRDNKDLRPDQKEKIVVRINKNLSVLNKIFINKDPLLKGQVHPTMYYMFIKNVFAEYGHKHLETYIKKFLESFEAKRIENLQVIEDKRDPVLYEFHGLITQGTNDVTNFIRRVSILTRYFLITHPDVKFKDTDRLFSSDERYAIYILAEKRCAECNRELSSIDEMEADHIEQHAFGGETVLKNARALCISCNKRLKENIQ